MTGIPAGSGSNAEIAWSGNVQHMPALAPPFSYYGIKNRAAGAVWEALGRPSLYVEPFAGSLAVLLARPVVEGGEVVGDANMFIPNFWRALRDDPAGLLAVAAQPVTEVDYRARHRWLVTEGAALLVKIGLLTDPDVYDLRVAGWWVWGQRASISRWCAMGTVDGDGDMSGHVNQRPNLDPANDYLGDGWGGVFTALSERVARVRVLCGGWERCVTDGVLFRHERTPTRPAAVFLDPPYRADLRESRLYGAHPESGAPLVSNDDVEGWCAAHQDDPRLRIVLSGLEGEYDLPGWRVVRWRAPNASVGNRDKERLWLSPSCAPTTAQGSLF